MNKISAQNNAQNMKTVKSDKDRKSHKEVVILVQTNHLPKSSLQQIS